MRLPDLICPILHWSLLPAGEVVFTTSAQFPVPLKEGESIGFFVGATVLSFALASAAPQFHSHVASLDCHMKPNRMSYWICPQFWDNQLRDNTQRFEEPNMGLYRRKFTREFKLDAIELLEAGASVAVVAGALEVSPRLFQRWWQEFRESPAGPWTPTTRSLIPPGH